MAEIFLGIFTAAAEGLSFLSQHLAGKKDKREGCPRLAAPAAAVGATPC